MTETEQLDKAQEVYRLACEKFSGGTNWAAFYREILGVNGIVRRTFPSREDLAAFEQTEEYLKIHQLLTKLRQRGAAPPETEDPTRVITVRLPRSLHEALRVEAHEHQTSMNKLCISKLLQFIDNEMVPTERPD